MNMFELGFGSTKNELNLPALPVHGKLPDWLHGTLVRNGPGTFKVGSQTYRHWFDGLAMLHKFSFADGKVSYANKFLETKAYQEAQQNGKISYSEFATDPCRSLFSRVMAVFSPKITDSAKVNVTRMADHYLALAETPIQVEFDPETLESVGVHTYEKNQVGQMTTVHPLFDPNTAETINLVTRYHAVSHYNFYSITGQALQKERITSIPVQYPGYIHSFGLTPNYLILAEFPLVVDPLHLLLWLRPYIENFRWKPQQGTKFFLIQRQTGQVVRTFETDAFFAFHHINAFETEHEVVVDLDAYEDASIIQSYYLNRLSDSQQRLPFGTVRRYRLPLHGHKLTSEIISDACIELPRIHEERYLMNPAYRYVYGVGLLETHTQGFYNQLVKIDVQSGKTDSWHQAQAYPGEAVFVPNPHGKSEDDGVLVSVVLDEKAGNSFLLVLDAASLTEIARAEIPQPILFGYHGAYFKEVG